jgi:membrane protein DedA with SNARE-associated domain
MDVLQSIISFFNYLEELLDITASNPIYYGITFFVYAVLATAFLPLPIELGLLISPDSSFLVLALVLGLGRAVGGVIVFYAGRRIGSQTHAWFYKWEWSRQVMDWFQRTVLRLGYVGLYVVMSIPFMLDSIPLYAFSLSDNEMDLKIEWFALTNFLAGFTRAIFFMALLDLFGVGTFHSLL